MNSRRCIRCDIKLSSRKKNRTFTQLCSVCYKKPNDNNRCIHIMKNRNRCKLRKTNDSDKCGIHRSMVSYD